MLAKKVLPLNYFKPRSIRSITSLYNSFSINKYKNSNKLFLSTSTSNSNITPISSVNKDSNFQLKNYVTEEQQEILQSEKIILSNLLNNLILSGADNHEQKFLSDSILALDQLFLVSIIGEFNSGKSSLINALLGGTFCETGVTPTTATINVLRYGNTPLSSPILQTPSSVPSNDEKLKSLESVSNSNLVHSQTDSASTRTTFLPVDWLKNINIVDTPGSNAVFADHQELTESFLPRSDLIMFIASADRPFSQSEREFCSKVLKWQKKVVVVLNKIDLFQDENDKNTVINYVRTSIRELLHFEPTIFPVSTRLAFNAKKQQSLELWNKSNFESLQNFIIHNLDDNAKIYLKLLNPIGVAERLLEKHIKSLEASRSSLIQDESNIRNFEEQLKVYQADIEVDFAARLGNVENVLLRLLDRVDEFITQEMNLSQIATIFRGSELQSSFENKVLADFKGEIDRLVEELLEWVVEKNERQARATVEYVTQCSQKYSGLIVGSSPNSFESRRNVLIKNMLHTSQDIMGRFDKVKEGEKIRSSVTSALGATVLIEAGAVGLSAAVAASLFDWTGLIGASFVALSGLYILPFQRTLLKNRVREVVMQLRKQLNTSLTARFKEELATSVLRINDSVSPYTRYVKVENERWNKNLNALKTSKAELDGLRTRIAAFAPK